MKKLFFFFSFVLISLLGFTTQVKADTIHLQMPAGVQPFCQSNGIDTYIFYKPVGYGSTLWRINGVLVGSGDSLIYTPPVVGTYSITALWDGNVEGCSLQLYPSAPSPITYTLSGAGHIDATQENMYMCGPSITLGFYSTGGVAGDYYWRRLDNINWVSTDIPITITEPGVYLHINENICGFTRDTFTVVSLPFSAPILSDTIFCNQTVNTVFDAGPDWDIYAWSTGDSTQSITPIITTDGVHNYTLTVSNVCGTYNSGASIEVQNYPSPSFTVSVGPFCGDTTLVVDPNYNYEYESYLWSTGDTSRAIYVNDDMYFSCTVTEGGCSEHVSKTVRFYETPETPEICVVTVDSSMVKNQVIWSADNEPSLYDPEYKTVESYNIYKLTSEWTLIGNVSADSEHVFVDVASTPPTQSAMYRISAVDECGTESEKSAYHRTILLLANQGAYPGQIPLSWNHYEDESGEFTPSQYYIYRGPDMSQLTLWDSVPGAMNSYVDTGIYSQTYYQIVAIREGGCNSAPAMSSPGKGGKSIEDGMIFSNKTSSQTGIAENNKIDVSIYPNPSVSGIFTVKGEGIKVIQVYNTMGQLILSTKNTESIDLSNYCSGVYYAKISNDLGSTNQKIVIRK